MKNKVWQRIIVTMGVIFFSIKSDLVPPLLASNINVQAFKVKQLEMLFFVSITVTCYSIFV